MRLRAATPDDAAALGRLIEGARADGAKVLLVDMPVTDEYVAKHPNGEADYQTFLAALRELAKANDAPLVELDTMRDHSLFLDEVHMNLKGAHTLTGQLIPELRQLLGA